MTDAQHTLYSKEIEEEKIEVENGLFQIIPKHTKHSLYLGDFGADGAELNDIYNRLRETEAKTLEIFIDSDGGLISEGQKFQNIIENHFPNAVDTYLDNRGYSIGSTIFLIGTRRIVHKHSAIMFHNFTSGAYGKGHELDASHKHQKKVMNRYTKATLKGYMSKQEIKELLNGKDFWFDSKDMLQRNIATHILIAGELISAKDYLKTKD